MDAVASENPKPSASESAIDQFWKRYESLPNVPAADTLGYPFGLLDTALRFAGIEPVTGTLIMVPATPSTVEQNQQVVDQLLADIARAGEINLEATTT